MRTFWKVLAVALMVMFLAGLVISISMYFWPDMPTSARPAEGRISPLNNHGHYTYMNEQEYLLRSALWWMFPIVAASLAAIVHCVDPFDGKRRRRLYQ